MSLLSYAEDELNRIGLTDEDEYNGMMRKHILQMVKVFADEGHSGFSAPYAISILTKLFAFKPLTPLTGEDDEWALRMLPRIVTQSRIDKVLYYYDYNTSTKKYFD